MTKSRSMAAVISMHGRTRNENVIFVGIPHGKISAVRFRLKWKDSNGMNIRPTGCEEIS